MRKKGQVAIFVIIALILVFAITVVILIQSSKGPEVEDIRDDGAGRAGVANPALASFTPAEQGIIISAVEDTRGRPEQDVSASFEIASALELESALRVCEEELVADSVTCYRTLAIEKPEHKEKICDNIGVDSQKEDCLMLIPFLG